MSYIGPNARVFGSAKVSDGAQVFGSAQVFGDAWVFGSARVFGSAWVYGGNVGKGAYVSEPHHVQTYCGPDGVLWTVYRRRKKMPRIMRAAQPVKYSEAPAIVRALAEEVAA